MRRYPVSGFPLAAKGIPAVQTEFPAGAQLPGAAVFREKEVL
jgi:hypothetical protein